MLWPRHAKFGEVAYGIKDWDKNGGSQELKLLSRML